jgi:uncharacterized membrane protein required for colicin V production
MKFNMLDALLLLVMILAGYLGYRAGPLKKSITLVVSIVSIVVGLRVMHPLGSGLSSIKVIPPALSYVVVFCVVVLAGLVAAHLLYRRFGKKTSAQRTGRIFAVILGGFEAAILLGSLLLMLKLLDVPRVQIRSGSLLYRPMVNLIPWSLDAVRSTLPEGEKVQDGSSGERNPQP